MLKKKILYLFLIISITSFIGFIALFIGIQFIETESFEYSNNDNKESILNYEVVSERSKKLLQNSCFNCHYLQKRPWLVKIAPFSWYFNHKLKKSLNELNFSVWENYSDARKEKLIDECLAELKKEKIHPKNHFLLNPSKEIDKEEKESVLSTFKGIKRKYELKRKIQQAYQSLKDFDIVVAAVVKGKASLLKKILKNDYTSCGIIIYKDNVPYVLEAFGEVRYTPYKEYINRSEYYTILRLKEPSDLITNYSSEIKQKIDSAFLGKKYDFYIRWNNDKIYTTELVWKVFNTYLNIKLCNAITFKELNLTGYDLDIYKALTAKNLDLSDSVVTPLMIKNSEKLKLFFNSKDLI